MLLIRCPYCEMDRPELEFRYGGEAHIARPLDPSKTSDEEWARVSLHPHQSQGPACGALAAHNGCGRFFNAVRHTVTDQIVTTYKAGEPRPDMNAVGPEAGR